MPHSSSCFVFLLAAIASAKVASAQSGSQEVQNVVHAIAAKANWVSEAQLCPTKVMPRRAPHIELADDHCAAGNLQACLTDCSHGDPSTCYWLAQALQKQNARPDAYEPVFQRACKLGVMSGCTNHAAGLFIAAMDDETIKSCAAQTYEAACAFDDPWACTMSALHLSRGMGTKQDTARALKALEKSCKHGPEDKACIYAARIRRDIEAMSKGEQ